MTSSHPLTNDIAQAIAAAGGRASLEHALDQRAIARDYIEQHYQQLLAEYPEHWIAVRASEVIAASLTLDGLAKELIERHLPVSEIVIRQMTARPQVNIF